MQQLDWLIEIEFEISLISSAEALKSQDRMTLKTFQHTSALALSQEKWGAFRFKQFTTCLVIYIY